jgi:crotonobetainyl-CoA:carnitine CoA-transferase CaiB-like acyl-CoA transferase
LKAKSERQSSQPLEGFTVIDLSYLDPGGYCTRLVTDFGALVIRVERPGNLFEQTDLWPWEDNPASSSGHALAARYFQINCNKESVVVDYTSGDGKDLFLKLVRRADVLIEGFRPGVMDRYGLNYIQ